MKSISYAVGQTYINEKNGKQMTIVGKHRAGTHRGAKTIWHIEVDGEQFEKDSEQIKRFFWEEKKAYTSNTTGRVTLTKEAIAKKVEGEWQKLQSAMKVCNDYGLAIWTEEEDFKKARTEVWTKEALRIEAEKKAKAEVSAKERQAKKESLDILKSLTPEQLQAIVAGLKK